MYKKIKRIILENQKLHKNNLLHLKELEWANIYHDSIRGKEWLEKLPLNIGRWAGNYSFFYVLNRILNDYKPNSILEFGLGESSKFISTFLDNELFDTNHHIIEQDKNWLESFNKKHQLSSRSKVSIHPLVKKIVNKHEVNSYEKLGSTVLQKYDLYIVDGPFGSKHFSRYDIVDLIRKSNENDEFIILIDDYQRLGEQETTNALVTILKEKGIPIYKTVYVGNKSVCLLGTEKYKSIESL